MVDTIIEKLDALQDVLKVLQSQELPESAIFVLHDAQQLLDDMRAEGTRIRDAVQKENQSRAKFVSLVSHELRIPLTSIRGYADLLRHGAVGPVNERQVDFLDVIRNNVDRMSVLITSLSDISKLETGRLRLDCVLFPLRVQVDQVVKNYHPRIEEKAQSLVMEINSDLPQVYGDVNRVVQVISILIDNAHRYTPAQGKIRLSAQQQDDYVRVVLEDNGIGISPSDWDKIFTQFFRSEDQAVREEQGWGLGLAVAKALVEQMGGQVGFESVLGEGSTFWFTLPTSEDSCQDQASA